MIVFIFTKNHAIFNVMKIGDDYAKRFGLTN
jgi:hypothetical protein